MQHKTESEAAQRLQSAGINLFAAIDLDTLPADLTEMLSAQVDCLSDYTQVLLFGSGGSRLWETLQQSRFADTADPIDRYSIHLVASFLEAVDPDSPYSVLYPGNDSVLALQRFGDLVGWHHTSPFWVGINESWGSWFAYRAVVLTTTTLPIVASVDDASPCDTCTSKPCISACPAGVISDGHFDLSGCVSFRQQPDSPCADRCLARMACPIALDKRYSDEQIAYHYGRSLKTIRALYAT